MKKVAVIGLSFMLCLLTCVSGCDDRTVAYIEGDFVYEIREQEDGEKTARIIQLSEEGKLKEIIILPKTLNNYRVTNLSYGFGLGVKEVLESDNLKRLYCPYEIYIHKSALKSCITTLEKVLVFKTGGEDLNITCVAYSPYYAKNHLANTLYYYNYLENEEADCYWIDDYDYGTKIAFIPPSPTRDGYVFDGWYKEKECVNKWNFEVDLLPNVIYYDESTNENLSIKDQKFNNHVLYQQTKLYAKWI